MKKTFQQLSKSFLRLGKKLEMKTFTLSNGAPVLLKDGPNLFSIISGLHGDEKSGPLFLYQSLKDLLKQKKPFSNGMLIIPIINDLGWDKDIRTYNNIDLNRQFKKETEINIIQEIMDIYQKKSISLHWDIHEDDTRDFEYIFGFEKKCKVSLQLSQHMKCLLEGWNQLDDGTSEAFMINHNVESLTTEAPPIWDMQKRIDWNKEVFKWLNDYCGEINSNKALPNL